ncbi:AEC family transporter [Texcoconibacillus texcoconensis]|uniref:Putative permease n=1 Tax=Texcoconibacillus texcoconensis TaxID=1095777 RepID=A0A840QR21_9BACI|nr:AEC family transporter [Texcoconibacillus texcoconensis]MBB5173800.1 putative permease [Texcoconibacillus texcoconensis]
MNGFQIIQPVLIMATIVVLGYIMTFKIQATHHVKEFIAFVVINLALPGVVVYSIFQVNFDAQMWRQLAIVLACALALNVIGMALGYGTGKTLKYTDNEARQLAIMSGIGNTGFIGVPLIIMLFGPAAGVFAAIYDAGTVLTVFSIGVILLQQEKFRLRQLKAMINPPLVTLIVSIMIVSLGGTIPTYIFELSEILSSLAAPMAMIYIGMLISEWTPDLAEKLKHDYWRFITAAVTIKAILAPTIAFTFLLFIDLPSQVKQVIVIQACMPTFITAAVIIARYTANAKLAMVTIITTAAASLFIIPLVIYSSFLL